MKFHAPVRSELERNIDTEISMLREISNYSLRMKYASPEEKKLLETAISSLVRGIEIINESVPKIIEIISVAKKLPAYPEKTEIKKPGLEKVRYQRVDSGVEVVLKSSDKRRFLRELSLSENAIRKLRGKGLKKEEKYAEFRASRGYLKLANRLFLRRASKLVEEGKFKTLSVELRRANIEILIESYVAMMILTTVISGVIALFLGIILFFVDVSFSTPFVMLRAGEYLTRLLQVFWMPFVAPIAAYFVVYVYPSTEKSSIAKRIDQELPFAVIHMNAISGSGIAPSEIFKIIGLSNDYPILKKEVRKVLNQINLYGYDLVTALNNSTKTSPSQKLADLFSGLSTTITSGASLTDFFEKRSENLMFEYRIERERYTKSVETFLDIYISVVIAAPMIFLLLLVMISISGIETGFSNDQIGILTVFAISFLNLLFLFFLRLKQPTY